MKPSLQASLLVVMVMAAAGQAPKLSRPDALQQPPEPRGILQGCPRVSDWAAPWGPQTDGATYTASGTYRCGSQTRHVFLAWYVDGQAGAEATSEAQRPVPGAWWDLRTATPVARLGTDVAEYRIEVDGQPLTVWSWFAIGDSAYGTRWGVEAQELLDALLLRRRQVVVVVVAVQGHGHDAALSDTAAEVQGWLAQRT